jgi:YD repeat-containing protein
MSMGWANLKLDGWASMSLDEWSTLPAFGTAVSPRPMTIAKAGVQDGFLDFAFVDAIPSGATTGDLVLLDRGAFIFRLDLLQIPSLGGLAWKFGVAYEQQLDTDYLRSDDVLGPGFDFPQNSAIESYLTTTTQIALITANRMLFKFPTGAGGESVAGTLTRFNGGAREIYKLTNSIGCTTLFYGLDPLTLAPGRTFQIADRCGNTMLYEWETHSVSGRSPIARLTKVTDGYGREVQYSYASTDPSDPQIVKDGYRLTSVTDFMGRVVRLQYDPDGRLAAVVGPSITNVAGSNTFPNGTAHVFAYDSKGRMTKVWFPNECESYVGYDQKVDVDAVVALATPRYLATYGTGTDNRVATLRVGDGAGVGGTYGFAYASVAVTNPFDPGDPIVGQTTVTDRKEHVTVVQFNAAGMPVSNSVHVGTPRKLDISGGPNPTEYLTQTAYNEDNQPVAIQKPEGDTIAFEYDTGDVGTFTYLRHRGLLKSQTHTPGSRGGSGPSGNVQDQLTVRHFYEPIFNQLCATIETRGNPITAGGDYFTPQNGGTTPTNADRSRYTTINYFDYQKNTDATIKGDTTLQTVLGLDATHIQGLLDHANSEMTNTSGTGGIPSGFPRDLGNINGDGSSAMLGRLIKTKLPTTKLPDGASQDRAEIFTSNLRGQMTTHTDSEGNVTAIVRHPYKKPDGVNTTPGQTLAKQYGWTSEVHTDVNPSSVGGLVVDIGTFTLMISRDSAIQPSTGFLNLVSKTPTYDPLGNPTTQIDPRNSTTTTARTELGEAYRVTGPDHEAGKPSLIREFQFDANRNVVRDDTQDIIVSLGEDNHFSLIVSGTTANLPTTSGSGGPTRSGWFVNE